MDRSAWSCLGRSRAKQKCKEVVWENGEEGSGKSQQGHGWQAEGGLVDGAGLLWLTEDIVEMKELLLGLVEAQRESVDIQKEWAEQMLNLQEKSTEDLINVIDVTKYDQDLDRDTWDYKKWCEEMEARMIDEDLAELAKEEEEFFEYVKWKTELKDVATTAGNAAAVAGLQEVEGEKTVENRVGEKTME